MGNRKAVWYRNVTSGLCPNDCLDDGFDFVRDDINALEAFLDIKIVREKLEQ